MLVENAKLRSLTMGSYEHAQARVRAALSESVYSGDTLIGTFPGHVILVKDDGQVRRVPITVSAKGDIVLGIAESLETLRVYDTPMTQVEEQALALLESWTSSSNTAPQRLGRTDT